MIGVAANQDDLEIAAEFFELFKTTWEPVVSGRKYDVILSANGRAENLEADSLLIYGSSPCACDREAGIEVARAEAVDVQWGVWTFPIFGAVALFDRSGTADVTVQGKSVAYARTCGSRRTRRVGYDLFAEIRHLLTVGQPPSHASIPTLELHIALLRHWLIEAQVPFAEVLPCPAGYDFTCCLTHDIDFFGIRRHFVDRTLAGFVVRASLGTVVDLVRGRRSVADAFRNLKALCTLPLVFLGLARDFWQPFEDYAQVEDPKHSTFFLVAFRDRSGGAPGGAVDARRAVRYQVSDISDEVRAAADRGSELGIHGIDAWRDAYAGKAEMHELASVTSRSSAGVRMHWLYFSDESPRNLEAAGFAYDSTWGYNDAVGYRAGTSQAFRWPGTERLMELPLSIMDSALFSSDRMALAPREALQKCRRIIAQARLFGGTVVINWHCRSLAPERLWRQPYEELLDDVGRASRAWVTTAGAAVDWFRWRRSIVLSEGASSAAVRVSLSAPRSANPGVVIRVYRPGPTKNDVQDIVFDGGAPCVVDFGRISDPLQAQVLPLSGAV